VQTIDRRKFNSGLFLGFGLAGCVHPESGLPDLVVTGIRWSVDGGATWHAEPIRAGSNVWFEADVKNQGAGPTPDGVIIGVAFRVDSVTTTWADQHTTSLPPGQTISLRANGGPDGDRYWNAAQVGSHTIQAHVDDVNRFPDETDKTNNTLEVSLDVEISEAPEGQYNLSYNNPPFWQNVMAVSWGASPHVTPAQLFWNLTSHFTNAGTMAAARGSANEITASGRIPIGGAQRWEDTWVQARPRSSFTSAPAWVNESHYNDPTWGAALRAWGQWIADRPQYWDKNRFGRTPRTDWNSWGGHWGHISPNMPLDAGDILPGMEGDTYGDWFAHKWGETAGLSGAWALSTSDFVDSHPHQLTSDHDFNARIIDRFETWAGEDVPGSTITDRANYIRANLINEWTDFWNESWGDFYAALVREIEHETGHEGVIFNQDGDWPSVRRMKAGDPRIIFRKVSPSQIVTQADFRTMQSDRSGNPPSFMIGSSGLWCARVPALRLGPNMHCWTEAVPNFQAGLNTHFPGLTGKARTDFGMGWLKRLWFGVGWMHIARTNGAVRRGVAWFLRGYWDEGTVDANWVTQIRTVIPTKPFGFALYYSVAIERAREAWWVATGQSNQSSLYLSATTVMNLLETDRVPVNYYVSDQAIGSLQASAAPSAWIVLNRYHPQSGADLLPTAERLALEAVAPILDTAAAAQAFNNPIAFSNNCIGYGFGDQNGRLIVVPTNLTSGSLNATVTVRTLPNGSYKATDLLTGSVINFSSAGGVANISVSISRWNTRALAITRSDGGPVA
jgi:hypothetical protein